MNPHTKKLLELIKKFTKVGEYKILYSNYILYICNEQSENEIKKTVPFIIASKGILRNVLNKKSARLVH